MSFLSRKAPADELPPLPYDPRSPEGLAARWVQWVAAAGPLANPVEDEDGRHAAANQPDDVWFLAGTPGKRMQRSCAVPLGRDLFLPIVNFWEWPATGRVTVAEDATGSLVVDGVPLELEVIGTPVPFPVAGARLNGVTGRRKPVPVSVWGLWKLVPALPPGEHHLQGVGTDGHGFTVDVSYRLLVSPAPQAWSVR
jgi:hypothetical protein